MSLKLIVCFLCFHCKNITIIIRESEGVSLYIYDQIVYFSVRWKLAVSPAECSRQQWSSTWLSALRRSDAQTHLTAGWSWRTPSTSLLPPLCPLIWSCVFVSRRWEDHPHGSKKKRKDHFLFCLLRVRETESGLDTYWILFLTWVELDVQRSAHCCVFSMGFSPVEEVPWESNYC